MGPLKPFTAIAIIPTGVGAEVGGYAGDATPAINLLAAACDRLLTHPNAVNAATLYAASPNVRYVEGSALDRFAAGEWALREVRANRVGLLLDAALRGLGGEAERAAWHAVDAARAVAGVEVTAVAFTERPVGARVVLAPDGTSHGEVRQPRTVLDGARALTEAGAEAIALACVLGDVPDEAVAAYQAGRGPDPIGGLEAVLSHLVVTELGVPCAHAPLESYAPSGERVDPRAAAEEVSPSYLPCVLQGLARAPRGIPIAEAGPWDLRFADVDAVVAPAGCLGGVPVLAAVARGIPVIAVHNPTVLDVTAERLSLPGVVPATSYAEAAGLLLAIRAGLAVPSVLRPLRAVAATPEAVAR